MLSLSERSAVAQAPAMPNLVRRQSQNITTHVGTEFFNHPEDFPMEVRTSIPWRSWFGFQGSSVGEDVGLRFFSGISYKTGSNIRIAIPLRHKNNYFNGRVISVSALRIGYEVSAVILSPSDGERLRMVERICALECELQRSIFAFNS